VENAKRLPRALVDRHGRDNTSRGQLDDLDSEGVSQTASRKTPQIGEERDGCCISHS